LHKIKSKSPKDGDPAGTKYSKTSAVNCLTVAFYHDNNNTLQYQEFPMMDVFLQGTSSLLYDIKNYQIKNFTKKDNEIKYNIKQISKADMQKDLQTLSIEFEKFVDIIYEVNPNIVLDILSETDEYELIQMILKKYEK
jgi:hypothetical protein